MHFEKRNGLMVPAKPKLIIGGHFLAKILRDGAVIDEFDVHNLIVNQGLDHILGVQFSGVAQIQSWFLAPFTNNYAPVAADTAATISGNAGETQAYTGSTRQPYTGVEGGQQMTNAASPASFTFTAALQIYGAFLISSSGFGATTGILFAAAQFTTPKSVAINDVLALTYAFGAASS